MDRCWGVHNLVLRNERFAGVRLDDMNTLTTADASRITLSHVDQAAQLLTIDAEVLALALLKAMHHGN